MTDEPTYLDGVPAELRDEMRELFFSELNGYSVRELVNYFNYGVVAVDRMEDLGRVLLPRDPDPRRELVHAYLLLMPEDLCAEFRTHLDDVVRNSTPIMEEPELPPEKAHETYDFTF